jgi:PIN domain nuclease of toxin-antitoxin system
MLLDTHAVLWFMLGDPRLSMRASDVLTDPANLCLISPVNHWEIAIKISVGKYRISEDFETLWREAITVFAVLPIEPRHTAKLLDMPFHHKDPFDRLLVATALADQISLVSSDAVFDAYGISRVW